MRQWGTSEFTMTCDQSGLQQHVSVALPARFGKIEKPPVIVCFDAPWVFGTVVGANRVMSFDGVVPEAVVVGLSFVTDSGRDYTNARARWFTPTPFVPPPQTGVKDVAAQDCGHSQVLIDFVRDQLVPRLETDYDTGERWFVGHSFSALLGFNFLLSEPTLFSRYLLASCSLWWDDRVMLDREANYADAHDDLDARVYLRAGAHEPTHEGDFTWNMADNVSGVAQRLRDRGYPSLQVADQILPGETHSSTIGAAVSFGLRALAAMG